ncbi:MAG TPA: extracellular solute-binding protein, partial [bacterium]|nr:extracellular solute-binding protein [bacterium]
PGYVLQVQRAGTEKLLERIARERAADSPGFDVVWLADFSAAELLSTQGLLAKYEPAAGAAIPPMFRDSNGYYAGSRVMCMALGYNTALMAQRPVSYQDLALPAYRGRVGIVDPHTSGASFCCVATLLTTPKFGWEYFKKLYDNGAVIVKDNAELLQRLAAGTLAVGLILDNQLRDYKRTNAAAPVDFALPADGMVLVVSPIAISARCARPDAARWFADWVLSPRGQELLATQSSTIPARTDVVTPLSAVLEQAVIIPVVPSAISREKERLLALFDAIFAGKPVQELAGVAP